MSTARRPTQERQTEIAEAALRLIARQGIAALTMSSLATELGITSGALFRHFPSREAILTAAASRAAQLLEASFPPKHLPPLEQLEAFARARMEVVGAHPELLGLLFSEQVALALPEEATERVRLLVFRSAAFLREVLTEAAARQQIRTDLPPEQLVPIVMATLQLMVRARPRALLPVPGKAEQIWETLLTLLAPPPPRK